MPCQIAGGLAARVAETQPGMVRPGQEHTGCRGERCGKAVSAGRRKLFTRRGDCWEQRLWLDDIGTSQVDPEGRMRMWNERNTT